MNLGHLLEAGPDLLLDWRAGVRKIEGKGQIKGEYWDFGLKNWALVSFPDRLRKKEQTF